MWDAHRAAIYARLHAQGNVPIMSLMLSSMVGQIFPGQILQEIWGIIWYSQVFTRFPEKLLRVMLLLSSRFQVIRQGMPVSMMAISG